MTVLETKNETFAVIVPTIKWENTFGAIRSDNYVEMEFKISIIPEENCGYFFMKDLKTGGDKYFGDGNLKFDGNKLTDFDGVYNISEIIIDKLKEWGYVIDKSIDVQPITWVNQPPYTIF